MKKTILKIGIALLLVLSITGLGFGQNNVSTLRFYGNENVYYGDNATLDIMDGAGDYTIEAWVYLDSWTDYQRVASRVDKWEFYLRIDGQIAFRSKNTDNTWQRYYSQSYKVSTGEWVHIAIQRDDNSSVGIKFYVNGVDVSAGTYVGRTLPANISGDDLYIGETGSSTNYFTGKIDEVRVTNTISSLNSDLNDPEYTTDANTAALFHFNENTGTTTANEAGGSATINGATWATFDDLWFPIELLSFDASTNNDIVSLDWTTLSETNNKGFEIQRSSDSKGWEVIGFVEGQGNSRGEVNYSFVDNTPNPINYYRLNQIDFDGNNTYSNTLQINVSKAIGNSIYPNPTSDILYIKGIDSKVEFEIYNKLGKLVAKGLTTNKLNVSSLKNGVYFIKLNNKVHKIIKI